jgi:two-component system, chemotaxis family, CheB/CheR fusion protein
MKKSKPTETTSVRRQSPASAPADDLSVVAVGASAGGIEAFTELVRNLATDTGLAFVFIQHLDPTHQSILSVIVGKETKMPVTEVTDGLQVAANHIFIIPPNAMMSISGNTLELTPREDSHGVHMSIDRFMRSLAEAKGNRSIGVILSAPEPTELSAPRKSRLRAASPSLRMKPRLVTTVCLIAPLLPAALITYCPPEESPASFRA